MPRGAREPDAIQMIRRLQEQVRQLLNKKRCHTTSRTYIIGGDVDSGLYIPEFDVGVDTDGNAPEYKRLLGFRGHLVTGSVTVDWYVNGSSVLTGHTIDTTRPNESLLDPPLRVFDSDYVRPVITTGSGADLSATAIFASTGR